MSVLDTAEADGTTLFFPAFTTGKRRKVANRQMMDKGKNNCLTVLGFSWLIGTPPM
jgi:hypothetical protein